jgi:dihydrofolate reductase
MKVSIIVANSNGGVIGKDNKLPWSLPADMANFKRLTMNNYVIMGRKTYESIGRALPYRDNLVVSKDAFYGEDTGERIAAFTSIEGALWYVKRWEDFIEKEQEVFIIGGQQIYESAIKDNLVDFIYQTEIHEFFEGDAFFKISNPDDWELVELKKYYADDKNAHDYTMKTWKKKLAPSGVN